jgi:hypothetical protein
MSVSVHHVEALGATAMAGGCGLLAQTIPGVPEDLKTWPVSALMALVSLSSLALLFYFLRRAFDAVGRMTEVMSHASIAQERAADCVREISVAIRAKPCLRDVPEPVGKDKAA